MKPANYRKKPVVIQAVRLHPDNVEEVATWCGGRVGREPKASDPTDVYVWLDIPTLEGTMRGEVTAGGDWVIRGVQGEFYPCKHEIFTATYDEHQESADA